MKIEKINDNQIRCTLTREELADRQIKLSELAYGSDKARSLFRDMIEQANYEFGFEAEDIPLMIEAIPLSGENIILQITKVEYPEELDTRFSKFSEASDMEDYERSEEGAMFSDLQGADDVLGLFKKMKEDLEEQIQEKENTIEQDGSTENTKENTTDDVPMVLPRRLTKMFAFRDLEDLQRLAHVLGGYFKGESDVYKDEAKNEYCLLVRKMDHTPTEFNKVCNVISEYGCFRKYTKATEAFFREHGKLILKDNAIEVLDSLN